jgi:hypothetical protein
MFNYRLNICAWRYKGKPSQYLCVATCANKSGEAIDFLIGCAGLLAVTL